MAQADPRFDGAVAPAVAKGPLHRRRRGGGKACAPSRERYA